MPRWERTRSDSPHHAPCSQLLPMPKRWRIATHDLDRVSALERSAGIPAVVAQLLIGRGILEPQAAKQFLEAKLSELRDPEQLPGAVQAAEILHDAIRAEKQIVVYGDYDADGMTATAILLHLPPPARRERVVLRSESNRRRLRPEPRSDSRFGARRRSSRGDRRLRNHQRCRSRDGRRVWAHANHHRSPSSRGTLARRGSDRSSGTARARPIHSPVCVAPPWH